DLGVFAREGAHDAAEARVDAEVAPHRTLRANRIGVAEIPRPRPEAVGFAREGAYRTDLRRVAGKIRGILAAVARGDDRRVAAVGNDQVALLRDLVVEARAAAAQDAALFVEDDRG